MERVLVERYHWRLIDLDATEIETLLPFFLNLSRHARESESPAAAAQMSYCDQADWM